MANASAVSTLLGQEMAATEGNTSQPSNQGLCSSINQENLTKQQLGWYWGFLLTLFITLSVSISSLMLLLYTDYYAVVSETDVTPLEAKTKEVNSKNDENSASFKTVLTINSSLPDKPEPSLPTLLPPPAPDLSAFVNFTPAVKSPVTLVDMKKGRVDKRLFKQSIKTADKSSSARDEVDAAAAQQVKLATETNLAAIPSDVLTKDSKEKTVLNKLKNKNKKPKVKKKLNL